LLLTSDNDVGRGQLRDWNEEFQGCKELPKKTVQDRIFRDRALIKVTYDFVDAATRGAVAIVNKTIPPLNPLDAEKSFMFIYNNIFFSYAMDARDFYKKVGGDRAAHIAANNDLKGVIAYNHADIDGLHTLLTAIVDYRGYRIVAQSIIPGILLREQTSTVHYGSMDHGATIAGNEEFHKLMLQAGKKLHVKEHEVTDEKGTKYILCSPVECKGIIGTDSRKYVLDLIRTTPRDANWTGRDIDDHTILRPEIIASYLEFLHIQRQRAEGEKKEQEKKEQEGTTEAEKKKGEEKQVTDGTEAEKKEQETASSVPIPELYFNPDVLVKNSKLADPEDVQKADSELVTEVSKFLSNIVIPALVEDFIATINCPIDGQILSSVLHSHGINIRYLGKIATLAAPGIPFFAALCEREMVARAAKYIFNTALRELDTTLPVAPFIAKFLNALLGGLVSNSTTSSSTSSPTISTKSPAQNSPTNGTTGTSSKKNKKRAAKKASGSSTHSSSQNGASSSSTGPAVTPSSLWKSIRESVKEKFQYELKYSGSGRPAAGPVLPLALLRSFVQKVGVQIEAKDYDFVADQPFNPSNILDLFPIVKHTNPRSSDGVELLQAGRVMLNQLPAAFELVTEALAIFHQVCGPMHVDTAICYSILAQVLVSAGDVAQALLHMKKAVIINERVRGLDHHETIQGYFLLAVFSQQFGHIHAALGFLKRAVYLSTVVCGPQHPETASQHLNLAHVLRDLQQHALALAYFQEVLEIYESVLGNDSMVSAQLSHEIAIQYSMLDDFKNALLFEKRNYAILKANFGENDPHTQESNIWLKQFTAKAVQMLIEAKRTQRDIIASLSQEKIEEVR
jgi:protein TIF31